MVSNRLGMALQELLGVLDKLRRACGSDPEYRELRGAFPPEWPL